jgi:hypothetical protein
VPPPSRRLRAAGVATPSLASTGSRILLREPRRRNRIGASLPFRSAGMTSLRLAAALALGAQLASASRLAAQTSASTIPPAELPLKLAPRPTSAAIDSSELMTRLYIFADDSMMGRQVGTEYNLKGTAYIEREVRRMGLRPAGEDGGYFQNLPLFTYTADSASTLSVAGEPLVYGADFFPVSRAERRVTLDRVGSVYGGSVSDSSTWISGEAAAGKVVVLGVARSASPFRNAFFTSTSRFARAAAILVVSLDRIPANVRPFFSRSTGMKPDDTPPAGPPTVFVTPRVATLLLGGPVDSVQAGTAGRPVGGTLVLHEIRAPGRNVVAVLPGSDPALRSEYVAIGAHNDHIGFNHRPVDHDSLRAFNMVARQQGADSPAGVATPEQLIRIRAMTDSLHRLHGVRRDSINNGADDDGSGSVSVLEIAEAFAAARERPRRSILFIWHTGEEAGLYGSQYFTDHPTVPRDSIVAELNMDMVGRGAATDVTGETKEGRLVHGGPGYLQLVGSRRLSTELGDLIEQVNREARLGFTFDYSQDANGHPQNIYCRSDHYEYARYGIPIVFFTTGGHADYHQVTDEPQYIDYGRMAQVARLVYDAAVRVANLDHRVVVDKPKPDPRGRCVQ